MNARAILIAALFTLAVGSWITSQIVRSPRGTADTPTPFEISRARPDQALVHLHGGTIDLTSTSERPPLERTGLVRGRVLDTDGEPIADAVVVGGRGLGVLGDVLHGEAAARTDDDGRFSIETFAQPETTLVAMHHEGGMSPLSTTMAGEQVELRLQPFARLDGFVRDGNNPVWSHVNVTSADRRFSFVAETDVSGHYGAGPLPPGDYNVSVFWATNPADTVAFSKPSAHVEAGSTASVDIIETDPGSLELAYHRTPGMPVSDAAISVFAGKAAVKTDEQFERLNEDSTRLIARTSIGDDESREVVRGIPLGTVTVCARSNLGDEGMHIQCEQVDLEDDTTVAVDLSLNAG